MPSTATPTPPTRRAVGLAALVLALAGGSALPAASGASAAPVVGAAAPTTAASTPSPAPAATAARWDTRGLDRRLRRIVTAGGIGAVAELDAHGREWRGAAGRSSLGRAPRAVPGAHVRAASNTKMLTAVLALQLVNRGRWTLDTTIGDVLPGLWPGRDQVTLRQLLSHTSGLPDFLEALLGRAQTLEEFVGLLAKHRTDAGLVRLARTLPLGADPGTTYAYSNTNFVVVGMMLRHATRQPLRRLAERRILRPAAMTQSTWAIRPGLPRPSLHEWIGDGTPRGWVDLADFDPTLFSAAGALVTTTRDLNRFQRALGRGRILPRPLVRRMRTVQAVDPVGGLQYGLGTYRLPDPCSPDPLRPRWVYGHDGASFGTFSISMSAPGGRRSIAVAYNGRSANLEPNLRMIELAFAGLAERCSAPSARVEQVRRLWPMRQLAQALTDRLGASVG